jgi:hypothetical protein
MKKLVLLFSLVFMTSAAFTQTILTTWEFGPTSFSPSITFNGSPTDAEIVSHIVVQNLGTESVTINVAREEMLTVPNTVNQFCWAGLCYSPTQDTAGNTMTLAPGESTNEFSGHLQPAGTEGVSIIKYTFFEVGNPSNFSTVIVHYNSLFSVSSEAGDSAISEHIRFFFGSANQDFSGVIKIHNHGSNPQNIIALRGAQLVPGSSENYFEFGGVTYPATADTSAPIAIDAGATNESFVSHYNANGSGEPGQIAYAFLDPTNPAAYAVMLFTYQTNLGLSEKTLDNTTFSAAYPNPAASHVSFDYEIPQEVTNAEIIVTNLLGAVVAQSPLEGKYGTSKIDVSNLSEGIYFATLRLDNYTAFTQKVLVQ